MEVECEVGKWWPLKLKLLEANYEKSKLKIRESSLYCKLSIIQLQNIVDEEKLVTEKYEKKAVSERLLVAKEQVIKHAKEKEAISKKAVDDLKRTEEEWKWKMTELAKKIESLQEEKQKETQSKKVVVEEISTELDILKEKEKEWKTENTRLLSKVGIMEKEQEKFSEILGKQKVDKEVQAETLDVDGLKNGEKKKSKSTNKSPRSRNFDKTDQIAEKSVSPSVPEACSGTDIEEVEKSIKDKEEGSDGENDCNRDTRSLKQCVKIGIPSIEETENGLSSCRKRSATETVERGALRSRSVSPGNLDTTGSKRSRKAKGDTEKNPSVLCESFSVAKKTKKKQRRVTFSGELDIREFDKGKEREEIIQDDAQRLMKHYNLRKPFNKQELRNDDSSVARDVLSVGAGSDSISRMDLLNDANEEEGYQKSGGLKRKKHLQKVDQSKQAGVKIREESGVEEKSEEACNVVTSEVIPISQQSLVNEHKNDCEEKRNAMGKKSKRRAKGKAEAAAQEAVKKAPRRAEKEKIKVGYTKKEDHFNSEDVLEINRDREIAKSGKQGERIDLNGNEDCAKNEASLHCEVELDDKGGREETGNRSGKSGIEGIEEETAYEDMQEKEEVAVMKRTRRKIVKESATEKSQRGRNKMVSESERKDSEEGLPSNGKKASRKGKKGSTLTVKNQIRKKEASFDAATRDDREIGVRMTRSSRGKRGIPVDHDETEDKAVLMDEDMSKEALQLETDVELPVVPKSQSKGKKASFGNKTKNYDEHETGGRETVTRQRRAKRRMAALNDEREDEDEEKVDGTKETAEQGKYEKTTGDESSTTKASLNEIRGSEHTEKAAKWSRKAKRQISTMNDESKEAAKGKGTSDEKTTRTRESRSRNKEVSLNDEKRDRDSEEAEKNEIKRRERAGKGRKVKSRRGSKVDKEEEEVREVKETPKTGSNKETVSVEKSLKLRSETLSCDAECDGTDKNGEVAASDHESEGKHKEKQEVGEKKKTPEDERVEKTRRKRQSTNTEGVSLNDETKEDGNGERGRKKVARQNRGMNGQNKETEDNGEEQEMKDTMKTSEKEEKKRSSFAVNEKTRSNEAAWKGKTPRSGSQKEDEEIVVGKTRAKGNVSGISHEATENKNESLAKTSSKLEVPLAGSSNITIGQQAARTSIDLQTTMDVSKPAKKKRRTLCSKKDNSTMISTTTLFQETLPLNQTKSSGRMPPSLSSFMKSFIVPKLKK